MSKDSYDAPESDVIEVKVERNLLTGSPDNPINPGGDTPGSGDGGDD